MPPHYSRMSKNYSEQVSIAREENQTLVTAFFEFEDGEIIIEGAEDSDGNDVPLTSQDEQDIARQLYEMKRSADYDRAEQRAEDMRDRDYERMAEALEWGGLDYP